MGSKNIKVIKPTQEEDELPKAEASVPVVENDERKTNRKLTKNITNWIDEYREKKEAFYRQKSPFNS